MKVLRLSLAIVLLSIGSAAVAADAPPADYKHLGVASCASSVCHGKLAALIGVGG